MDQNSIFITQDDSTNNITYTNIIDNLPKGYTIVKDTNWKTNKQIKWRWRFLKFDDKTIVEISYKYYDDSRRVYFNKSGNWVYRQVPKVYDQYVTKKIYYYVAP